MQVELFAAPPRKGEQARRKLLLAGLKYFGEKGFEDASVREIAGAAGKNVASIAYYFGSKEQLYHAVIEGMILYIGTLFAPYAEEARAFVDSGSKDHVRAAELLKVMLRVFLMEHLERDEMGKIRHLMMREQSEPTEAFNLLFDRVLKPMNELYAKLMAIAIGEPEVTPKVILRSHTIFCQVIGITVARHTILRRLNVTRLEPEHVSMIMAIVDEHVDLICAGLLVQKPA